MKKSNKQTSKYIYSITLILSSIISFVLLCPYYKIFSYEKDKVTTKYDLFGFLEVSNAEVSGYAIYIVYYSFLLITLLIGISILFLTIFKKQSIVLSAIEFLISMCLAGMSLSLFFNTNGLNAFSVIVYLALIFMSGIYLINASLSLYIKKQDGKIQ